MAIDPTLQAIFLLAFGALMPALLDLIKRRGDNQHHQATSITAIETRIEERFKTVFARIETLDQEHTGTNKKLDAVCDKLSDLCARFDMLLGMGRADALTRVRSSLT